ncbi:hypothetical protein NUW58_g2744 [Xylaria curta]|uniref:Uncharacterized protein n=1 Tax=Xylaria curta TaxID=42375 RepID=A0ACC1PF26_9PEZI|nr:hypothetical protein NUW58_g2744 [Xylaria curta]
MANNMPNFDGEHLRLTKTGFNPKVDDVIEVRRILTELGIGNHTVPMEIALQILSLASYYPRQSITTHLRARYEANEFWGPGPEPSVAGLYLAMATTSVPDTIMKAHSITFQMKAADQGWATFGGNGTYDNSHTWYEASILRPRSGGSTIEALTEDTDMENSRTPEDARDYLRDHGWDMVESNGTVVWKVHNNITACDEYRDYRVDWVAGIPTEIDDSGAMGDGQGFLELLKPNDVIALWARAEQQAWVNKIREATIEIEYVTLSDNFTSSSLTLRLG